MRTDLIAAGLAVLLTVSAQAQTARGPIGIVGLAITTGNPDAAACKASCSASNFERV